MMNEKLSEQPLRQKKVELLKDQLMKQTEDRVNTHLRLLRAQIAVCTRDAVRAVIDEIHVLYVLQDFLKGDTVFMRTCMIDTDRDIVIYRVGVDTIDWMLNEEYLLLRILRHIEAAGGCAEVLLNDEFFERDVFGIMERILWEKKM